MSYDIDLVLRTNDYEGNPVETEVFRRNHTSNTAGMWRAAGFDFHNYHGKPAGEMVSALEFTVKHITENPEHYKQFESDNGWGTVASTISFLTEVFEAAHKYPTATVHVSA